MEGVEYNLNNTIFRVYSEEYKKKLEDYITLSKSNKFKNKIIIGGYTADKNYSVVVKGGKLLNKRAKVKLTRYDKECGRKPGNTFKPFNINGLNILPVICYEICFPELWEKLNEKVDLIIHHIGIPMFTESQARKWAGLQKRISSYFKAPLICSVGKGDGSGVDISGIVMSEELENRNRWNGWIR